VARTWKWSITKDDTTQSIAHLISRMKPHETTKKWGKKRELLEKNRSFLAKNLENIGFC